MPAPQDTLTIGAFARAAGVNVETIRFYQRWSLLPEPDRPYGGIPRNGATDVTRVKFVKSAPRLGFSLDDIAQLLKLTEVTHCAQARRLGEEKLAEVRIKLVDLTRMEAVLARLVEECGAGGGTRSCPLIQAMRVD